MKSILIITAFPPNQKTAGQDYTRRLILDLLSKGYDISLIYTEYPKHKVDLPKEISIIKIIKPTLLNCFNNLLIHPLFTKRYNKKVLLFLQKQVKYFDILYFDFSQVHIYSLFLAHPCKILMCHDVILQKYQRNNSILSKYVKNSEKKLLSSASRIITFSKKDCDLIINAYGLNSSNVNFYIKKSLSINQDQVVLSNSFCFYGAWNRRENSESLLWFISNVLPYLDNKIRITIIGSGLSDKIKLLLNKYYNITVLGFIQDPVLELSKHQALIAPLFKGAGVKVKVIDALSSGTPVIGTDIAFEGITDNDQNSLFNLAYVAADFIFKLNNWKQINIFYKINARDEFFNQYDKNYFSDYLIREGL